MPMRSDEVRDLPPLPSQDDSAKVQPPPQPVQRDDAPHLPPSAMGDWALL